MHKLSAFLDRYFVPLFRWLTLAVCATVALNYIGFWWYWEFRLPAWGAPPSQSEFISARLVLFWAFAALALGAALFNLIRSPLKLHSRAAVLFCMAAAGGIAPYLINRFVLS
jgi:hypothetical protein